MTRKTAATRHLDSTPKRPPGSESGTELADVLVAFHNPTRRWLIEVLAADGPASVGMLAARTGLAVGSVSHHLKTLHRHGFVEPAPDLARDSRESWWRPAPRRLSWSVDDFESGTPARRVADAAEAENFRHQTRAIQQWLSSQRRDDWRKRASSSDTLVPATRQQLDELGRRLNDLITTWTTECQADAAARPQADRRPVRVIARAFPSRPVRP